MNPTTDTIYVVIPVYKAEKTLRQCVRSIQKQTYDNLRIILVDDGSPDRSGTICDALAAKDTRIRVLHRENAGSFAARRAGVNLCGEGERDYICFCDADDYLPPAALQTLHDACVRSDADISVGPWDRTWHGVTIHADPSTVEDAVIDRDLFLQKYFCSWYGITRLSVSLCSKLFRARVLRTAYNEVPPGTVNFFGDDLIVTLHACAAAKRIVCVPEVTYVYRMGGGTSRFRPDMLRDYIRLYRHKMAFAEPYLGVVPQNLRLLSDIELCNVAFTYFRTLNAEKKIPPQKRREIILESVRLPEIRAAAENVLSSDYEKKAYAQMIAKEDSDAIEREAQPISLPRKVRRRFLKR